MMGGVLALGKQSLSIVCIVLFVVREECASMIMPTVSGRNQNGFPPIPSLDIEAPGWTMGYGTGGRIWPSAAAMCRYLSRTDICRGKHIIELGCGAAATGLFAGASGSLSVTLSDSNIDVLSLARRNANANSMTLKNTTVSILQYSWGSPAIEFLLSSSSSSSEVLILGSDITYYRETQTKLCSTITDILRLRPKSRALLAHQHRRLASFLGGRGQLDTFYDAAHAKKLQCNLVHRDTSNPASHISLIELAISPDR